MKVLFTFTLGLSVLGAIYPLWTEVVPGKGLGVEPEFMAQEYEPPSRGRSDEGIGGDTRFDERPKGLLIS